MTEGPNLLVEWASPWREFRSSIGPALGRSPAPLAGEAPTGLFPLRGLLLSWGAEAIVLALAIVLRAEVAKLQPYHPPPLPRHDVIYFHGNELPRVEDFGGAQTGRSGMAGGKQAHHASQTIRVVRGDSVRDKVVDAPNLRTCWRSSRFPGLRQPRVSKRTRRLLRSRKTRSLPQLPRCCGKWIARLQALTKA